LPRKASAEFAASAIRTVAPTAKGAAAAAGTVVSTTVCCASTKVASGLRFLALAPTA
jgi:hypothetical protein